MNVLKDTMVMYVHLARVNARLVQVIKHVTVVIQTISLRKLFVIPSVHIFMIQ